MRKLQTFNIIAKNIFFFAIIFLISVKMVFSQGLNHTFLLGYDVGLFDTNVTSTKARLNFDSTSVSIIPESRKMAFDATQGNISDQNGNLLMSSNGCWIANASGDTMMNGNDLNPGIFALNWCTNTNGYPIPHGNLFLPYPGDSNKYILFHQSADINLFSKELYYTVIDMSLDSGLGGVTLKNQVAFQDTLSWGITACKHANGRDWWIVALKDNSNIIYKLLLTPNGIDTIISQVLNVPFAWLNAGEPTFSPDGNKFAYTFLVGGPNGYHNVRLFHFDRCTGNLSDTTFIPFVDASTGWGLAFSSDSKYLYHSSFQTIYQINTDTMDILASIDTVAFNDGYYSPYPPFQTNFCYMYLAADGKIYITPGNGVIDLHYINYPDSAGLACDVHLHDLHLPCFSFRGNVNHPNYYLGPVIGSTCDSLVHVGINEMNGFDFHFSISPNPSNGSLKIIYLMPQNKSGVFEIYDFLGKKVYSLVLPPWSSLQYITLPKIGNGLYSAVITSGGNRVAKKLVFMQN